MKRSILIPSFLVLLLAQAMTVHAMPPAPVIKTGQANCWDQYGNSIDCTGTGQDGDLRVGLAWPTTRFSDNGDETITDKLTGLIWAKNANVMATRDPSFDTDLDQGNSTGWTESANDGGVTWQHALDYVKKLNAENYLGHNDWRLPNINELKSMDGLVGTDTSDWIKYLSDSGFTVLYPYMFWSSSSSNRWQSFLNLSFGGAQRDYPTDHMLVWAVRGVSTSIPQTGQSSCYDSSENIIPCQGTGQDGELRLGAPWPPGRFSDNGDATITDTWTGLIWTRDTDAPGPSACGPGTIKNWQAALDHIKCLNQNSFLGKNDWRLPNTKELESLAAPGDTDPSDWISSIGFIATYYSPFANDPWYYWTSTTSNTTSTYGRQSARMGRAGEAGIGAMSKDGYYHVWPVRGGVWDALRLSPEAASFSTTLVGSTSAVSEFQITNTVDSTIQVNGIALQGSDAQEFALAPGGTYACTSLAPTLEPGESCTVQVMFAPSSIGKKSADLEVQYDWPFSNSIKGSVTGTAISTTPIVSAFTIPSTWTDSVVPIYTFTATDDTAVTGYCVTESDDPQTCAWTGVVPQSHTFSGLAQAVPVSKTLYAFARDAAGNVSKSLSAKTTIILPDTSKPVIGSFKVPASSTSLVVPIQSLVATDNVSVSSYCVSESNNSDSCRWGAAVPTQYTFAFSTPSAKTLYAFAKDAAGNVSAPASASVTVDTSIPTVTDFVIPAASTSAAIPVTIAATDNIGVTGYFLTSDPTPPSATAAGWTSVKPALLGFYGLVPEVPATKTVYVYAKDACGNVSEGKSATITVTYDGTKPVISTFALPSTSSVATVALTIVATDNVGITGYYLSTSATTPVPTAVGWTATKPVSYTFTGLTVGIATSKALYLFAKDANGNVSAAKGAATSIKLPDVTKPVITGFTIPATAVTAAVPITTFTVSDNVAVTGYYLSTSATTPTASALGWTATKPTSYTFTGLLNGVPTTKTLYAFVKDAAGNVSLVKSAATKITLPDTTKPVISTFTLPATSISAIVPILSLTASDNAGVTGYFLSTSATTPLATTTGWSNVKPISYTFTGLSVGVPTVRTLYAFVKDAANNVSLVKSAATKITLSSDLTKPTITAFAIPATSLSATIPITTLTVVDNVGITGYFLSTSAATPNPYAPGWIATKPASYTFSGLTAGAAVTKTLYVFTKDAAGNVSAYRSANVALTPLSPMAGKYSAFSLGTTADLSIDITGSTLKISDTVPMVGTCVYTGTVTLEGFYVKGGTYQCTDLTTGTWSLGQMKVVDANDVYLSLQRGQSTVRAYGMKAKTGSTAKIIGNVADFVGDFRGISNGGTSTTDYTTATIADNGTTLKITEKGFVSGTCVYTGSVATKAGTYTCSDLTSGTWALTQLKKVDTDDVYLSILKNGNSISRMYGIK